MAPTQVTVRITNPGETDVEPLRGLTALESVSIEVDPVNQRL